MKNKKDDSSLSENDRRNLKKIRDAFIAGCRGKTRKSKKVKSENV